jgi:hypothetical protein
VRSVTEACCQWLCWYHCGGGVGDAANDDDYDGVDDGDVDDGDQTL